MLLLVEYTKKAQFDPTAMWLIGTFGTVSAGTAITALSGDTLAADSAGIAGVLRFLLYLVQ